jgi:uncharacterized protein YggE
MPHRSLALLVALAPIVAAAQVAPQAAQPLPPRSIRVMGDGKVSVRPDVAVVLAGVEVTGKDLAQVTAGADSQLRKVLAAVEGAGVSSRDVQTTRHDLAVERPWKEGKPGPIAGYVASEEVRVIVRDVAKLGVVLDRVVAAGANTLRGLSFEKDDPTPERARALALAVASARARAEAIAKAAGVSLGDLLLATESAQGPVPVARSMLQAKAAEAPVSPGEVEVSAAVEVTYAIR